MMIEVLGEWINPDKIIRLHQETTFVGGKEACSTEIVVSDSTSVFIDGVAPSVVADTINEQLKDRNN